MVFQNAIHISRTLGIEWLWIDSLCILQDNISDWEIESSKMGSYYENSYLTISASSSSDGTVPFLIERDNCWHPRTFAMEGSDGKFTEITVRKHNGSHSQNHQGFPSPVDKRAWTWQENVLSARVLHYREAELTWECRTDFISEDGTEPCQVHFSLCGLLAAETDELYDQWQRALVMSYSGRALSFAGDRLPSISGVVSKLQARLQSGYFAGLWQDYVPTELCWMRYIQDPMSKVNYAPEEYIAPSWSWASVSGAFLNAPTWHHFQSQIEVLDIYCSVPGKNKFGKVSDGYLVLKAPAISVSLNCEDAESYEGYEIVSKHSTCEMLPDCVLETYADAGHQKVRRAKPGASITSFSATDLLCVNIGRLTIEKEDLHADISLVLTRTLGDEETYTRVGLLSTNAKEEWFRGATERVVNII